VKRPLPPSVERRYEPDEGACVRAVEILLESVMKEDGPPTVRENAKERTKDDFRAEVKSSP
jgi:hypothetical protein